MVVSPTHYCQGWGALQIEHLLAMSKLIFFEDGKGTQDPQWLG